MSLPRCGVRDKVGYASDSRSKRYALQGIEVGRIQCDSFPHFWQCVSLRLARIRDLIEMTDANDDWPGRMFMTCSTSCVTLKWISVPQLILAVLCTEFRNGIYSAVPGYKMRAVARISFQTVRHKPHMNYSPTYHIHILILFEVWHRPKCGTDHSPPSSGEVMQVWSFTTTSPPSREDVLCNAG